LKLKSYDDISIKVTKIVLTCKIARFYIFRCGIHVESDVNKSEFKVISQHLTDVIIK